MLKGVPSRSRAVSLAAILLLFLLVAHLWNIDARISQWPLRHYKEPLEPAAAQPPANYTEDPDVLPCRRLPGGDDVVVVMRTGATEIQDKLPIHFNTTFQCYKDLLIFSDYEEVFMGHQVHDVLRPVDQGVKETNSDFELYLRLQSQGRAGLLQEELSGQASFEGGKSGKNDRPGWRLDKWKFLPMMIETLRLRPGKKWYVFLESDSYLVWSNLLQWLGRLDASKPIYSGSEVQIGPDQFGHGGSIFVMTEPAVRKGAEIYTERSAAWHDWTAHHWAGDCVLGKALFDAGVPLTWTWPMLQGGQPEKMDFAENKGPEKKLWCSPAISYHHFSPQEKQNMWQFEQDWIVDQMNAAKSDAHSAQSHDDDGILRHKDVFRTFVFPRILLGERDVWNNLSPNLIPETVGASFEECRAQCEKESDCVQYSHGPEGCSTSSIVMLGEPADGFRSDWLVDRIEQWMHNLDDCSQSGGWTVT